MREQEITDIAVMKNDIGYIKAKLDSVDTKVSSNYVTKDEFLFYKRLTWIVLGAVVTGLATLFLNLLVNQS